MNCFNLDFRNIKCKKILQKGLKSPPGSSNFKQIIYFSGNRPEGIIHHFREPGYQQLCSWTHIHSGCKSNTTEVISNYLLYVFINTFTFLWVNMTPKNYIWRGPWVGQNCKIDFVQKILVKSVPLYFNGVKIKINVYFRYFNLILY